MRAQDVKGVDDSVDGHLLAVAVLDWTAHEIIEARPSAPQGDHALVGSNSSMKRFLMKRMTSVDLPSPTPPITTILVSRRALCGACMAARGRN